MTTKTAAAIVILASFMAPATAQSIGGPNRPKNIGGPVVPKNPVVAQPRSAPPVRAPAPVKPAVGLKAGTAMPASPAPQQITAPRTKMIRP